MFVWLSSSVYDPYSAFSVTHGGASFISCLVIALFDCPFPLIQISFYASEKAKSYVFLLKSQEKVKWMAVGWLWAVNWFELYDEFAGWLWVPAWEEKQNNLILCN